MIWGLKRKYRRLSYAARFHSQRRNEIIVERIKAKQKRIKRKINEIKVNKKAKKK